MARAKTAPLKETNPIKYYKRRKKFLAVGKVACNLLPALTVLIVYAVCSLTGGAFTNPLVPWRFGVGIVMLVVGTIAFVIHELRAITKANKEMGDGANFNTCVLWLFIATILWLFYLTMFYLIIFCFAEFVGSFLGAFCISGTKKCNELIRKNQDAELSAEAMVRVQNKHASKIQHADGGGAIE